MPTVWDDTKVVHGEIGKYATIARRSGDDWFIGTINGDEARDLQLSLTFLDAAKKYRGHVYADDETISSKTKVSVNTRPVDSQTQLRVPLKPTGGQAIWIECLPAPNQ